MKKRKDKGNSGETEIRSLHVKLPTNHPIFLYPSGERSKVAREWMDRGREVESVLREIKKEIIALSKAFVNNRDCETVQELKAEGTEGKKSKVKPGLFLDL